MNSSRESGLVISSKDMETSTDEDALKLDFGRQSSDFSATKLESGLLLARRGGSFASEINESGLSTGSQDLVLPGSFEGKGDLLLPSKEEVSKLSGKTEISSECKKVEPAPYFTDPVAYLFRELQKKFSKDNGLVSFFKRLKNSQENETYKYRVNHITSDFSKESFSYSPSRLEQVGLEILEILNGDFLSSLEAEAEKVFMDFVSNNKLFSFFEQSLFSHRENINSDEFNSYDLLKMDKLADQLFIFMIENKGADSIVNSCLDLFVHLKLSSSLSDSIFQVILERNKLDHPLAMRLGVFFKTNNPEASSFIQHEKEVEQLLVDLSKDPQWCFDHYEELLLRVDKYCLASFSMKDEEYQRVGIEVEFATEKTSNELRSGEREVLPSPGTRFLDGFDLSGNKETRTNHKELFFDSSYMVDLVNLFSSISHHAESVAGFHFHLDKAPEHETSIFLSFLKKGDSGDSVLREREKNYAKTIEVRGVLPPLLHNLGSTSLDLRSMIALFRLDMINTSTWGIDSTDSQLELSKEKKYSGNHLIFGYLLKNLTDPTDRLNLLLALKNKHALAALDFAIVESFSFKDETESIDQVDNLDFFENQYDWGKNLFQDNRAAKYLVSEYQDSFFHDQSNRIFNLLKKLNLVGLLKPYSEELTSDQRQELVFYLLDNYSIEDNLETFNEYKIEDLVFIELCEKKELWLKLKEIGSVDLFANFANNYFSFLVPLTESESIQEDFLNSYKELANDDLISFNSKYLYNIIIFGNNKLSSFFSDLVFEEAEVQSVQKFFLYDSTNNHQILSGRDEKDKDIFLFLLSKKDENIARHLALYFHKISKKYQQKVLEYLDDFFDSKLFEAFLIESGEVSFDDLKPFFDYFGDRIFSLENALSFKEVILDRSNPIKIEVFNYFWENIEIYDEALIKEIFEVISSFILEEQRESLIKFLVKNIEKSSETLIEKFIQYLFLFEGEDFNKIFGFLKKKENQDESLSKLVSNLADNSLKFSSRITADSISKIFEFIFSSKTIGEKTLASLVSRFAEFSEEIQFKIVKTVGENPNKDLILILMDNALNKKERSVTLLQKIGELSLLPSVEKDMRSIFLIYPRYLYLFLSNEKRSSYLKEIIPKIEEKDVLMLGTDFSTRRGAFNDLQLIVSHIFSSSYIIEQDQAVAKFALKSLINFPQGKKINSTEFTTMIRFLIKTHKQEKILNYKQALDLLSYEIDFPKEVEKEVVEMVIEEVGFEGFILYLNQSFKSPEVVELIFDSCRTFTETLYFLAINDNYWLSLSENKKQEIFKSFKELDKDSLMRYFDSFFTNGKMALPLYVLDLWNLFIELDSEGVKGRVLYELSEQNLFDQSTSYKLQKKIYKYVKTFFKNDDVAQESIKEICLSKGNISLREELLLLISEQATDEIKTSMIYQLNAGALYYKNEFSNTELSIIKAVAGSVGIELHRFFLTASDI